MKKTPLLLVLFLVTSTVFSQLLTWYPQFASENANSFVINLDASRGNKELNSYSPTSDVYVHIGVITNKSTSSGDWKYVKYDWGSTVAAARAAYTADDQWSYTLSGNMRQFFGISDPDEHILKIAILFRNGAGSKVQRNADMSDMYIPVYTNDLAVKITDPVYQPSFIPVPEDLNKKEGAEIAITAQSSAAAQLKILYNGNELKTEANATSITATTTIASAGNQVFVAEAFDGNTKTYDTLQFYAQSAVTIAPLPAGVRQGINYTGTSTATLVLFAPEKSRVALIGDFEGNNWTEQAGYQLNKTPDGNYWWITLNNLTPEKEYAYQFLIDGKLKVADPFAEKILDPFNDKLIPEKTYPGLQKYPEGKTTGIVSVLQTSLPGYKWKNEKFERPDKRNLIIYELLVRDFVENHNWQTLIDSLNYFKKLGINAIELMPFNEFEGNESWGYNPNFYFAPDKYYGTANTLKEFIDSCHSNGIAVIMDMVLNHSFGSSPMVQMYWDAEKNRPAKNSPWFNPVAKHAYNVGFDLNHESTAAKYFVSRVAEHWLRNYKIDGFRWDLSKGFTQKQTCDDEGNNCDVGRWSAFDAGRVAIWKGYYDTIQLKAAGAYSILEHFADNQEEKELSDYGMLLWGNANYSFNQATMGYNEGADFSSGFAGVRGWEKQHLVTYMESHDEERLMFKNLQYGNSSGTYNVKDLKTALARQQMAATFFLAIPGPKLIWQFGELGYDYSINYCGDGSINESCRVGNKPIKWDYLKDKNRKKLFDVYSKMIHLRQNPAFENAFISGSEHSLSGSLKWIKLNSSSGKVVVIGNFDVVPKSGSFTFPVAGAWNDLFNESTFTATGNSQEFTLAPGEFYVFTKANGIQPATLLNFEGKNVNGKNVLEWQVQNEENLKQFVIEKSEDGRSFKEVQVITATGKNHYSYTDEQNHSSTLIYYRLKLVDVDGKVSYSDPVSIKITSFSLKFFAAPNPFPGELKLRYESPAQKEAKVIISDAHGRKLVVENMNLVEGTGQLIFPKTRTLSSGTYFLTLTVDSKHETMKVIKNN